MSFFSKLEQAIRAFDAYNAKDPNREQGEDGQYHPKELLYATRMTTRLERYQPDASEAVKLAVRCQHIGRWEIPRNAFPMDRKGYLQWRSKLAIHHANVASEILQRCGYEQETIDKVQFLLKKQELRQHHPETQLLEDVICLVFIEFYLDDFAQKHDDQKVIEILKKTMQKMSARAIDEAGQIKVSARISGLLTQAAA